MKLLTSSDTRTETPSFAPFALGKEFRPLGGVRCSVQARPLNPCLHVTGGIEHESTTRLDVGSDCVAQWSFADAVCRKKDAVPGSAKEKLVGAWRLAWMEEPGPVGKLRRISDRKGMLLYSADYVSEVGVHSVQ